MNKDNKITKKDIVEGMGFILMIVGIIGLIIVTSKLRGVTKEAGRFMNVENRK